MGAKGDQGDRGLQGQRGEQGEQGEPGEAGGAGGQGPEGPAGPQGSDGLTPEVEITELAVGDEDCPAGGALIEVIVGDDSNETVLCNGLNGNPGTGNNSLIATTPLQVGDDDCPNGGTLIESGLDENNNELLDEAEVGSSEVVCNGATGPQGPEGPEGPEGPDGAAGPQGQPGNPGSNGTDGQPGEDGPIACGTDLIPADQYGQPCGIDVGECEVGVRLCVAVLDEGVLTLSSECVGQTEPVEEPEDPKCYLDLTCSGSPDDETGLGDNVTWVDNDPSEPRCRNATKVCLGAANDDPGLPPPAVVDPNGIGVLQNHYVAVDNEELIGIPQVCQLDGGLNGTFECQDVNGTAVLVCIPPAG
jgi:hypothetical protein